MRANCKLATVARCNLRLCGLAKLEETPRRWVVDEAEPDQKAFAEPGSFATTTDLRR